MLAPLLAAAAVAASPCTAHDLSGSFKAVPNSEGAGNIVYALRLRNVSSKECFLSGIPGLRLLGRTGAKLPTTVRPAQPGALTAVIVRLAPGAAAGTTARFSPDVPGVGEGGRRVCEPKAYRLAVTPNGGGTLVVPITPATSVCEHGTLTLKALSAAR